MNIFLSEACPSAVLLRILAAVKHQWDRPLPWAVSTERAVFGILAFYRWAGRIVTCLQPWKMWRLAFMWLHAAASSWGTSQQQRRRPSAADIGISLETEIFRWITAVVRRHNQREWGSSLRQPMCLFGDEAWKSRFGPKFGTEKVRISKGSGVWSPQPTWDLRNDLGCIEIWTQREGVLSLCQKMHYSY